MDGATNLPFCRLLENNAWYIADTINIQMSDINRDDPLTIMESLWQSRNFTFVTRGMIESWARYWC